MKNPDISVVIPFLNAAETLGECLASLTAQTFPRKKFEIIAIDNGSKDGSAAIAEHYVDQLLTCEEQGAAAARNEAVSWVRGGIVAFIDADCVADPEWLSAIAEAFTDERISGIGGKIEPYRVENYVEWLTVQFNILSQEWMMKDRPFSPPFPATANAAYRKSVFDTVGLFDNTLCPAEDADLAWRVQWAGGRIKYLDHARVLHHNRDTFASLYRQFFSYNVGETALMKKHRSHFPRRPFFTADLYKDLLVHFVSIPVALAKGRTRYERAEPALKFILRSGSIAGRVRGSIKHGIIAL